METTDQPPEGLPIEPDEWQQTPPAIQGFVVQLWDRVKEQEREVAKLRQMLGDEAPTRGKKRVLVVDDSPLVRKTVGRVLEKHGHQVCELSDGILLLKEAKKQVPDLIIMDVNMPKKSGVEALEELRQDPELKDIPVIMLTSETDRNTVRRAAAQSALGYIIKDTQDVMEKRLLEFIV